MGALWEEAIKYHNFPLTALVGLVMVYWLLTIFGIFDSDAFEPDLDLDVDVDVDIDVEADVDVDAHSDLGHGISSTGGMGLLRTFGLGEVPLVVLLSVLIISMWVIAIFANYILNPLNSLLIAFLLAIPNFIVSMFVMKFTTMPLRPFFRALRQDPDAPEPVVGRTGTVRSSEVSETFGQIEVPTKGTPLYLNARIAAGDETLKKGDEALVYKFCKENGIYMVRKSKLAEIEQEPEVAE